MQKDLPRIYGIKKTNFFFLMHLYVPLVMRKVGLGTQLLKRLIEECANEGCRCIKVDDMSEHSNRDDNIYIKCGFRHKSSDSRELVLYQNQNGVDRNDDTGL